MEESLNVVQCHACLLPHWLEKNLASCLLAHWREEKSGLVSVKDKDKDSDFDFQ
jgi:hypothetical protein